ncbi:MAG: hypothetical protein HY898_11860 [Deltaproteobacteria bacterium]|nr:hypothetical protein [Deltaproteobacteria bacterium]
MGDQRLLEPIAPAQSRTGVDLAQIHRMLDLSPIERVQVLEDWVNGITELRELMSRGDGVGQAR